MAYVFYGQWGNSYFSPLNFFVTFRSHQVLGNNGPVTPARGPGEKRKRSTPPSGDPDRPALKHQRPGSENDNSSSPLSQRLERGSRNESASNSLPGLPGPGHELEGQSTSDQMGHSRPPARLPRREYFTPIEEEGSGHERVGLVGVSVKVLTCARLMPLSNAMS